MIRSKLGWEEDSGRWQLYIAALEQPDKYALFPAAECGRFCKCRSGWPL